MQYRREIDGLRTIAVVPVILFHAGFSVFSGGYVGVDVFFVISGYLITTILIDEREKGTYSLLGFYERRARRILPALFLVMAVCLPFAWLRMPPDLFEDYARSILFAALFVSNVHFWEFTGYFAADSEMQPLLHTWSLAVEEQYYLLFPLVLMALGAFRRNRFALVFGIMAALSLALSEWGWRNYPEENFFFTFSRFWELLAGSLCAVWMYRAEMRPNEWLAALGLALIVYAILFYDALVPFPSVYALVPVLGAMLIILFAGPRTVTARLLSLRPMVAIGLISYSAYLWHQPLFAFARIWSPEHPSFALMGTLAVVSIGLAWLSWRYVELPFRNRRAAVLPGRPALFGASLAGMAVFVAIGAWGMVTEGFKGRLDRAMTPYFAQVLQSFDQQGDFGDCFPGGDDSTRFIPLCTVFGEPDASRVFGVTGDSHAMALMPGLGAVAERFDARILGGALPACPPIQGVRIGSGMIDSDLCAATVEAHAQAFIDAGVEAVFLVSRWSLYATGTYEGFKPGFGLAPQGGARAGDADTAAAVVATGLARTVARFTEAGVRVILVAQVPAQISDPRLILERALLLRMTEFDTLAYLERNAVSEGSHAALQAPSRAVLEALAGPDVVVVSVDRAFARDGRFIWLDEGRTLYNDDDHLSPLGAVRAGPVLAEAVAPFLDAR